MQLCMEKTLCYVLHIAHSGVPHILKSLLEDNSSIKVGICIDNDARKMMNDYGVCVQPLMDLSILANIKLAGPPKRWSLASLTQMITCKELPKPSNIRMGFQAPVSHLRLRGLRRRRRPLPLRSLRVLVLQNCKGKED